MKSGLLDVFKVINEIYTVKRMTVAERILIRQKKDLINYIAIHFWSLVKTILVFFMFLILSKKPELISLKPIYVYIIVGSIFLVFNFFGIKAVCLWAKGIVIAIFKTHKVYFIETIKYFQKVRINIKTYKLVLKFLAWPFYSVIFILVFPLLYLFNLLFLLFLYLVVLLVLIFDFETWSLIIVHMISKLIPFVFSVQYFSYVFYFLSFILIYMIIDVRVKLTDGKLYLEGSIDYDAKLVKGLPILSVSTSMTIFQKDNKFLVLDNKNNNLKIYVVRSRWDIINGDLKKCLSKKQECQHNDDEK